MPGELLDAVAVVLASADGPIKSKELTARLLKRGLWSSAGKTPAATVEARIAVDIKKRGKQSRFVRTAPGTFAMNPSQRPASETGPAAQKVVPSVSPGRAVATNGGGQTLSFTDAAENVLRDAAGGAPMHYREVTERALASGLLRTEGKTPEATLYAQIYQENERRAKRGLAPRFVRLGKGMIGLTEWLPGGLAREIEKHNTDVKGKLLAAVRELSPADFEAMVGTLLSRMGFEDVQVTSLTKDGGIDARGVLVVGEAIRVRMAIQAKRWKANVHSPTIQQVRGSLGAHERGLIITTSDYGKGARDEAVRANAAPVALMSGSQLVDLLVEYRMGVDPAAYELLTLVPSTETQGIDAAD